MDRAVHVKVARLLRLCSKTLNKQKEILKLVQANYFHNEIKILKDFKTQTESEP